jgi:hypothetical protein
VIPRDVREFCNTSPYPTDYGLTMLQDLTLQDKFVFPDLEPLCKQTIQEIITGLLPGADMNEYRKYIVQHLGVNGR